MRERYFHIRPHSGMSNEMWVAAEEAVAETVGWAVDAGEIDVHNDNWDTRNGPDVSAVTICRLVDDEGNFQFASGYAFCSTKDQFSKKKGRGIARTRAYSALSQPPQEV